MINKGDRVKLKGQEAEGRIEFIDDSRWVTVDWDADGPYRVHESDLQAIKDS